MLKKSLFIFFTAGVLAIGINALAEEEQTQNTVQSQEEVQVTERHEAEVRAGTASGGVSEDAAMMQERTREGSMETTGDQDRDQDKDQLRDQDRDRTKDQDRDRDQLRDQDHDRTREHQ
jgi:hypothetical protein